MDWPNATFYAELAQAYPDAKVILTHRDPQAWFSSTQATIFPNATPPDDDIPFNSMYRKVIGTMFDRRMRDHDHVIDVYNRHTAQVREHISTDRLLVYVVAQGWEPLCAFLGVGVPDTPMPKVNATEEFGRNFGKHVPS